MYELPASVRLALWLTHALHHNRPLEDAVADALPDVDSYDASLARIELWRDLGERVVCVDLPHVGGGEGLLPASSAAYAAALDVGECLFVPSLGGALVPRLEIYGPPGDEGLRLQLETHDSDPVPAHRLDMLSLPEIDRRFREAMLAEVAALEKLDALPFGATAHRARADERMLSTQWALPAGLNPRALRIVTTAGLVTAALDEAHSAPAGHDARSVTIRDGALRRLFSEAQVAMAQAATVAALELSGQSRSGHSRRS